MEILDSIEVLRGLVGVLGVSGTILLVLLYVFIKKIKNVEMSMKVVMNDTEKVKQDNDKIKMEIMRTTEKLVEQLMEQKRGMDSMVGDYGKILSNLDRMHDLFMSVEKVVEDYEKKNGGGGY